MCQKSERAQDMRKRDAEPKSAGTLCLHRLVLQSEIEHSRKKDGKFERKMG